MIIPYTLYNTNRDSSEPALEIGEDTSEPSMQESFTIHLGE